MGIAKAVVEKQAEVKLGALKIELGDRKGEILEAKVEGKEELIESLKEEVKRLKGEIEQIKEEHKSELKGERERVVQELKEKTSEIGRLQKQLESQADKTQDGYLNVIEMITKNSSRPSSPTPPPYDKQ